MIAMTAEKKKSRAAEDALWDAYTAERSEQNRNALVEFHIPLSYTVTFRFMNKFGNSSRLSRDEVLSEASVILIRCVEKFNRSLGYRFSTYFVNAFFMSMIRISTLSGKIRRERMLGENIEKVKASERRFHTENETQPEDFSETVGCSPGEAMECVSERVQEVIRLRFFEGMTLQAIADRNGVTREWVRQIISGAIVEIRKYIGVEVTP